MTRVRARFEVEEIEHPSTLTRPRPLDFSMNINEQSCQTGSPNSQPTPATVTSAPQLSEG